MAIMTTGVITPDLAAFRELAADRRVIAVTRRFLADGESAIGLYRRLAGERVGTFLLESAEHGVWSRYSFIGVRSELALTEQDGQAQWLGDLPAGLPAGGDPLAVLGAALEALRVPPGAAADSDLLPPLTGGFVGYLGYDTVRRLERIGTHAKDDLALPELTMLLASDLAVLDHSDGTVTLIANAINHNGTADGVDAAYQRAVDRLERMTADLAASGGGRAGSGGAVGLDAFGGGSVSLPESGSDAATSPESADSGGAPSFPAYSGPAYSGVARLNPPPSPQALAERISGNRSRTDYQAAVETAKERIRSGDAFQIVLSQRFELHTEASALDIYRVLRASNPSPYMYLFRFPGRAGTPGFDVVGSSPEALVKVTGATAMLHPIAGTRPRGATPERDSALAAELLADPKERAEHLMLVDLGRNDLGRISAPGTVEVVDFMSIEKYSHVMHIVSTVVGQVAPGRSALDVLLATFPAGTLSGAPKPKAMEIIDELEPTRRGLYGGCVGYLDFAGNADTAIAIRTALLRDGTAYIQAGAGIVADSDPALEDAECRHKAMAVLRAVAAADGLTDLSDLVGPAGPRAAGNP
jgi:anthranilate synthase component I